MSKSKKIRLLALDGGGVRGLSSLLILRQLMSTINLDNPPKPCDYFDMIGGTSTGGLIAIMLGRLQMTVDDCITAYTSMFDRIFEKKRHRVTIKGKIQGRFDADELKRAVIQILRGQGLDENSLLKDEPGAPCKVFVCAASRQTGDVVCLTSYLSPRGGTHLFDTTKIWQACRATSAATSFFDPISVGPFDEEFVDGALGANNPVYTLWNQAQDIWGNRLMGDLGCLVSIGTGVPPLHPVRDDPLGILSTLKDLATETERTSEQFRRDKANLDEEGRYYRFNVDRGLESIGLDESKKKNEIAAATSRYVESQGTFRQIKACAARLASEASHQAQYILSSEDRTCLRDLQTTNPSDDKARIVEASGGLLQDVYSWVLHATDFKHWRDDSDNRILWIKGDPGKGKTMLVSGIIEELTHLAPDSTISFFFCQAADARINNCVAVIRGLMYSLFHSQPSLMRHIRREYDEFGKELFEGVNAWVALSKCFANILRDPCLRSTFLIIDALDECNDGLPNLLQFVTRNSAHRRVKWIVSSRNWPAIQEWLDDASRTVMLSLESNEESVSDSVAIYIQHKVQQLALLKNYNDSLLKDISHYLLSNAQGTFLWVSLVCQGLSKFEMSWWNAPKLLTAFPPGLKSLYRAMLDRLDKSEDAEICRRILGVSVAAYRPITLDELPVLVDMPSPLRCESQGLSRIIELCGSFLTVRAHAITFIHQSAKDYLLMDAKTEVKPHHRKMFLRSLQAMRSTLRRNIYNINHPGTTIEQVKQPKPDPLAATGYSCVYWVDHLHDYDFQTARDYSDRFAEGGVVEDFLKQHYLHWIEALSLLGRIPDAVAAILRLQAVLQRHAYGARVLNHLEDAYRFLHYFKSSIQVCPLQVYSTALLFSPSQSSVRRWFKKDQSTAVTIKSTINDDWGSCLQMLEGHSQTVESIAWSRDGTQIASASYDHTVRVWDSTTGRCVTTLNGHEQFVISICWSQDGSRLLSASFDQTVKAWDPVTGHCISTYRSDVRCEPAVWSPDGKQLANEAYGGVDIWDLSTGKRGRALRHCTRSQLNIAWSRNGTQLASASLKRIKIWDLATGGTCILRFKHFCRRVPSIEWSHDGKYIASSSEKSTKFWDTSTGSCVFSLKGYGEAIAWSYCGTLFALGGRGAVSIWNLCTGKRISQLKGHAGLIVSISWSPDGTRIASSSSDQATVKIWDLTRKKKSSRPEYHRSSVLCARWSPVGTELATASNDQTIKVWDANSGQCRLTLTGHTGAVNSISWSSDGTQIASASNDLTVRVWNLTSGTSIQCLVGHTGSVWTVAWSPKTAELASGSCDGSVKIWDLATETCIFTIGGGYCNPWVVSVAWSLDATRLAWTSSTTMVKIWDLSSQRPLPSHSLQSHLLSGFFSNGWNFGEFYSDEWNFWELPTGLTYFDLLPYFADCCAAEFPGSFDSIREKNPYSLTRDRKWVTYRGQKILWLPPDNRPKAMEGYCTFALHGKHLAIGSSTGQVLILEFFSTNFLS